jgi:hypothetical protein
MKKVILTGIILGLFLFTACGGKTTTAPNPTEPIDITAAQLYKEYTESVTAADKQYQDKTLSVAGVVKEIGKDQSGTPSLLITGSTDDTNGVYCLFNADYDTVLAKLTIGQKVTITGVGAGFAKNVILDCRH